VLRAAIIQACQPCARCGETAFVWLYSRRPCMIECAVSECGIQNRVEADTATECIEMWNAKQDGYKKRSVQGNGANGRNGHNGEQR